MINSIQELIEKDILINGFDHKYKLMVPLHEVAKDLFATSGEIASPAVMAQALESAGLYKEAAMKARAESDRKGTTFVQELGVYFQGWIES